MNGKHYIISIILSAVVLLQSASFLLIDTSYITNHSYIASVLCINRDKPQMHCDGKCLLKKELNDQQEKQSSQKTIHSFSPLHFFCEEVTSFHFFDHRSDIQFPKMSFRLSPGFITTNERPPAC